MIKFNLMNIDGISESLTLRRKELGVSQAQLADICGISVHTLSNVEAGNGNPTIGSLMKIADALGMDIAMTISKRC